MKKVDSQEQFLCPWWVRVSALIDGELPDMQQEMVLSHAQSCATCATLLNQHNQFEISPSENAAVAFRPSLTFPQRNTPQLRALLAIIGVLIILGSVPGFIRGNTDGNSFHDLRHLSIWQFAIGVGALSAAISFRISRLLMVVIATFLLLTVIATVYDLLTGHRGPWTDPLHLVEIAAALALMRLIYPHLKLFKISNRDMSKSR
jgi:hypothetical protein